MLDSGTRLGPYEVLAPLGAGGMGEVYRARDTRLERTVAIKILPAAFASNAQLRQRFEREARLISQLSHPHICTIHDVGHDDGVDYLVMELLEGETLADRLAKGPLPVAKAVQVAIEIGDALDRAHRQGIVHRDLKPSNVMLTRSGAKLLDFGLAKSALPAIDGNAPTVQKALTEEGTIVGTFQYMAPEQLEGLPADARTDLFAFGAVLYEMLTGKRAFEGKTRTSVIAAIVDRDPPPITQFQPMAPPALQRLVRNCLAKNPDDRWQTAHDVLLELRAIAEGDSAAGVPRPVLERRRKREITAWTLTALLLLATTAASVVAWRAMHAPVRVVRTSIVAPPGMTFDFSDDDAAALTISPDGRYVTFIAPFEGVARLWVRRLDQSEAQPLAGTDGARYPFWSPDSSQIAFFTGRTIKKIPARGGAVVTITDDVRDSRGGAWGANDVIVYSHHWRSALYRVSADGGKATPITQLDAQRRETTHRYPRFLPDGEHFLFLAGSHLAAATSGDNAVYVASVRGGTPKLVVRARSNAVYASGHVLFYSNGRLMAQPFDPDKLETRGEAIPVADNIRYQTGYFRAVFDASEEGTLLYQRGGELTATELVWFDRSGKELGKLGQPDEYFDVRIAPNGNDIAIAIGDPADLWLYDGKRGVRTRLTYEAFNEHTPVFSPDGTQLMFATDRDNLLDIYRRSLARADELPVLKDPRIAEAPNDWSGDTLVFEREDLGAKTQNDLWALSLKDGKQFPLVQTDAVDIGGRVSPDGKWLAYTSLESGNAEVYVTTLPRGEGKWQVSNGGGAEPRWRHDGKELIYVNNGHFMAVPVTAAGTTFEAGTPVELFTAPVKSLPPPFYDVTPDAQTLLVNRLMEGTKNEPVTVVTNWVAELRER